VQDVRFPRAKWHISCRDVSPCGQPDARAVHMPISLSSCAAQVSRIATYVTPALAGVFGLCYRHSGVHSVIKPMHATEVVTCVLSSAPLVLEIENVLN